VHLAVARRGRPTRHVRHVFAGDRAAIREAAVAEALDLLAAAAQ
jgi:nicotinamide mononucleotide (NMN) deamidase PncC